MIRFIIVTHGLLAQGLANAMEMIMGPQEAITVIGFFEEDSIDELEKRIEESVTSRAPGESVLIFVDLFGASPFNASARVASRHSNVDIITGVNLPMMLEMTIQRQNQLSLSELVAEGIRAGTEGIKALSLLINQ
jgi:mannose/fructose/sorbose-specific phosphotransferase system IIA component